ncbi:hypothetical protein JZ751_027380, partial [Albula glossodonta]
MAALRASATERVCALAKHRQPKPGWQPDRPLLSKPKAAVGTVVLSSRIGQLACPKKVVTPLRLQIETRPTLASLQPRTLSSRLRLLSTPKPSHPQYQLDRPVSWPVPVPAREAVASNRVQVLAQPKPRKGLFEGYNPFSVSPAARNAYVTPRILELSKPIPRKCILTNTHTVNLLLSIAYHYPLRCYATPINHPAQKLDLHDIRETPLSLRKNGMAEWGVYARSVISEVEKPVALALINSRLKPRLILYEPFSGCQIVRCMRASEADAATVLNSVPAGSMGSGEGSVTLAGILGRSYGLQEEEEEEEDCRRQPETLQNQMPLKELLALYGYEVPDQISRGRGDPPALPANLPGMTLDKDRITQDPCSGKGEELQSPPDDLIPSTTSHISHLFRRHLQGDIMVGSQYQAAVPPLSPYSYQDRASECEGQLLWAPGVLSGEVVECFLLRAQRSSEGGGETSSPGRIIRDSEQALYELVKCSFDTEEALRRLRFNVRTRSVGECVEYYYMWKKLDRHNYFTLQTAKLGRKKYTLQSGTLEDEEEEGEGDGCTHTLSSGPRTAPQLCPPTPREALDLHQGQPGTPPPPKKNNT